MCRVAPNSTKATGDMIPSTSAQIAPL
jgi:hypothetical protein